MTMTEWVRARMSLICPTRYSWMVSSRKRDCTSLSQLLWGWSAAYYAGFIILGTYYEINNEEDLRFIIDCFRWVVKLRYFLAMPDMIWLNKNFKLEEVPFKSKSLYVMHYNESLGAIRPIISTEKKIEMAYHISKVLTFLFYRKICHRDLKWAISWPTTASIPEWLTGAVFARCTVPRTVSGVESQERATYIFTNEVYSTEGQFQRYF